MNVPKLIKRNVKKANYGRHLVSLFKCFCGNEFLTRAIWIKNGHTRSCGCLKNIVKTKHGHSKKGSRSLTYVTWYNMIQRCFNPKTPKWQYYGGKGVTVCESWKQFKNFLNDMGERPKNTSLDRIDSDKNYEISNCRWATITEQNNNLSSRKLRINEDN